MGYIRTSAAETEERLASGYPGWKLEEGKWLVRRYRFGSFMDAIRFVNEAARIAEELNHHPMIAVDYRVVTLRLTTWNAGGLTELDWTAAGRFDVVYGAVPAGETEA